MVKNNLNFPQNIRGWLGGAFKPPISQYHPTPMAKSLPPQQFQQALAGYPASLCDLLSCGRLTCHASETLPGGLRLLVPALVRVLMEERRVARWRSREMRISSGATARSDAPLQQRRRRATCSESWRHLGRLQT